MTLPSIPSQAYWPWQISQGARCGCRGTDEWCGCQNIRRQENVAKITETIEFNFENEEQQRRFHEALERPFSSRQAAAHLLPLFLEGSFENCGDDMAQDAADAGGDVQAIIENWLRGVAGLPSS